MTPFAALILDRDPYLFADFPGLLQAWFQDAGGFLYVGLFFYLLVSVTRPQAVPRDGGKKGISPVPLLCWVAATLLYTAYILMVLNGTGANKNPLQGFGLDLVNVKPMPDPNGYVKVVTPKLSLFGYAPQELPTYVRPFVKPPEPPTAEKDAAAMAREWTTGHYPWQALLLTVGGLVSFFGATAPMVGNLAKLRLGRIWAMAVLCMKEGLRNRLFLACLIILVPLMFPINWFFPPKPEDELRSAINWVAPITAFPLAFLTILIGSYALPSDVKNQNIYTIVTKPVERFEIVLGRFVGYGLLLSALVLVVGLFTLLTINTSNPSQESKKETGTARVPVRGRLSFESRKADFDGTDVGREFNYRKHIGGSPLSSQRAVYSFRNTGGLSSRTTPVPVEFNFDIYRLTKGDENKGVNINVRVVSWQRDQAPPADGEQTGDWRWGAIKTDNKVPEFAADAEYDKYKADALIELRKVPAHQPKLVGPDETAQRVAENILVLAKPGSPEWDTANLLAERYGFFEYKQKEVFDFHPERIDIPPGLFKYAAANEANGKKLEAAQPRVRVYVHCTSSSQMLGMAEGDLYLLEDEQPFWWNHLKSQVGLWCWLLLAIGLAVTLSTYLDFIVTLLVVGVLFVLAFFAPYINELGQTVGIPGGQGGPFKSFNQLIQAKSMTALPEETTLEKTAEGGDVVFAWALRRLLNVLPDVHSFVWTPYVAEGFSVPGEALVMNVVVLFAYLFPWFLMSYYLIRGREVAA